MGSMPLVDSRSTKFQMHQSIFQLRRRYIIPRPPYSTSLANIVCKSQRQRYSIFLPHILCTRSARVPSTAHCGHSLYRWHMGCTHAQLLRYIYLGYKDCKPSKRFRSRSQVDNAGTEYECCQSTRQLHRRRKNQKRVYSTTPRCMCGSHLTQLDSRILRRKFHTNSCQHCC